MGANGYQLLNNIKFRPAFMVNEGHSNIRDTVCNRRSRAIFQAFC